MKPRRLRVWLVGALLILIGLPAGSAAAHTEGKMQLASEAAGPYKMTVWTSPEPVNVGELHVAVALVLAEDASPVLDAAVFVELEPIEGSGQAITAQATAEDATNKFLREAIIDLTSAGTYLATITIRGADGQSGSASFEFEAVETSGLNWPLIIIGSALAVLAAALLWHARRRNA